MLGKVGSLNASAAAAIVLYEATRQRGESTGKIPP
jgi:tRNA G18 (ribose-2'-O)-methylase SpoU